MILLFNSIKNMVLPLLKTFSHILFWIYLQRYSLLLMNSLIGGKKDFFLESRYGYLKSSFAIKSYESGK